MAKFFSDYDCKKAILRLAKGDMTALSVVYDNTHRLIFSLALSLLGNREDAEDVLQDTMLKVAKHAADYKNGSPKAWVLSIARNRAIDILRKRRPTAELSDSPFADPELEKLELTEAINALDDEEKQAVILHIYGGLSHKEIGVVMDTSAKTAQRRYRRALQKLKELL